VQYLTRSDLGHQALRREITLIDHVPGAVVQHAFLKFFRWDFVALGRIDNQDRF
jgi:hypothetical protein